MRVHCLLSFILFAFVSLILADPTENYKVTSEAAARKGVRLEEGKRYAFYEYWAVSRLATFPKIPDCISGYKHIRLVVGQVPRTTRQRPDKGFQAQAWDLSVLNPQAAGFLLNGGQTVAGPEPWQANKNENGDPVGPNQYVYAGTVSKPDNCIKAACE